MLAFVIPLKSAKTSNSWERTCTLFERCLKSVCNQTSSNFRVIVVCNEQPHIKFEHPNVSYLEVDFPLSKEANDFLARDTDKGRKILAGLMYARKFNPSHAMSVDADDCVSKKLAQFVQQHSHTNGWFINQGYRYEDGSDFIYHVRRKFHLTCGSCNILRYDLLKLPENAEYNRGYGYYKYYINHSNIKDILEREGTPIKALPFPGAIYIIKHGENLSFHQNSPFKNRYLCKYEGAFKNNPINKLATRIFDYRSLNYSIREDFLLI